MKNKTVVYFFVIGVLVLIGALIYFQIKDGKYDISDEDKVYCTLESRIGDACITLYEPVCGYFNQEIKCVSSPCAQTYSNSCFACLDEKVEFYVNGECLLL